jgi:hypothetical protein
MALPVEFGIVAESKLDGAAEDGITIDISVCFGHNLAVDAAWRTTGRSPMVFYGFLHDLKLFGREPLLQSGVGSEDLAATQVMIGSVARHTQIVIGGYGINHIDVGPCALDKFQRIADDARDVLQIVCTVEFGISGEDLGLDELY